MLLFFYPRANLIVNGAGEGEFGEVRAEAAFLGAFEDDGDAGVGDVTEEACVLHHAEDVGDEGAVEGGVLLLAMIVDLCGDVVNGEDVTPELLVVWSVGLGDVVGEAEDIGEEVISLTLEKRRGWREGRWGGVAIQSQQTGLSGGGAGGGGITGAVTVVVDDGGGVGVEILHMADVEFLMHFVVGVSCAGIACDVEFHDDFSLYVSIRG